MMEGKDNGVGCESPFWFAMRQIANVISHMIVGLVVFFVVHFAAYTLNTTGKIGDFQLHMIFSVCGYQLLMAEAILSYNRDGPMGAVILNRQTKRIVHMVLSLTGVVFSITGASLAIKVNGGKFNTAHGVCGLIAMIFSIISIFNGFVSFFSPQLRNVVKPAYIKSVHTICGSCAIIMGLVTLILGINKPFLFVLFRGRATVTCLIVFIVLNILYILIQPVLSLARYFRNMRTTVL